MDTAHGTRVSKPGDMTRPSTTYIAVAVKPFLDTTGWGQSAPSSGTSMARLLSHWGPDSVEAECNVSLPNVPSFWINARHYVNGWRVVSCTGPKVRGIKSDLGRLKEREYDCHDHDLSALPASHCNFCKAS